jgi:hypothetical protein
VGKIHAGECVAVLFAIAICDIDILLCVNLVSRGERNYVHESFFFFSQLHSKVVLVERKPQSSLTGTKFRPLVTILETKGILSSSFQTVNFAGSGSLMACRTSQHPWVIRPWWL